MRHFIVLFFIFLFTYLTGQPLPCNTYGGFNSERAYALVQSLDSGYCLAGWTKSFGPGTPQFSNLLIVKTNQLGIPQWAKMSIGLWDEEVHSMVRTFDGGYALTGWTKSYGIGAPNFSNIFILKLDAAGNLRWGRVFGGDSNDQAYSIIQTQDSGYAVTGWTNSFGPPPHPNIIVLKVDKNGNLQWVNVYWRVLAPAMEEGYGITELTYAPQPYQYAVCGRTSNIIGPAVWDAFVMALNPIGNVIWARNIAPSLQHNEAYSVVWDPFTQTIGVAGWTNSYGPNAPPFANLFVWRLGLSGNYLWGNAYGWFDDEKAMDDRSLILTQDSGYAVAGWTKSIGPNAPPNPNFFILKLNFMGQIQWSRVHPSLPGANFEEAYPMIQTFNRGYAIAGWTNSFGLGMDDFHFLTLDQNGNRPYCVLDTMPTFLSFPQTTDSILAYRPVIYETLMFLRDTFVMYTEVCTTGVGIGNFLNQNRNLSLSTFANEVRLTLREGGNLLLSLFDASGRQILILSEGFFPSGDYSFSLPNWLKPGLYFLEVKREKRREVVKVLRF